jgi:hypothetical protein
MQSNSMTIDDLERTGWMGVVEGELNNHDVLIALNAFESFTTVRSYTIALTLKLSKCTDSDQLLRKTSQFLILSIIAGILDTINTNLAALGTEKSMDAILVNQEGLNFLSEYFYKFVRLFESSRSL